MNQEISAELPNPFRFESGKQVRTVEDWQRRRSEIRDLIVGIEYGGLPPAPLATRSEELHAIPMKSLDDARKLLPNFLVGSILYKEVCV